MFGSAATLKKHSTFMFFEKIAAPTVHIVFSGSGWTAWTVWTVITEL
jgi:hypothetical protein